MSPLYANVERVLFTQSAASLRSIHQALGYAQVQSLAFYLTTREGVKRRKERERVGDKTRCIIIIIVVIIIIIILDIVVIVTMGIKREELMNQTERQKVVHMCFRHMCYFKPDVSQ
ncbi:hypothetical protein EYF80_031566 [Liparis tanakae]|uniref:Uncharacterized protein n=1 Tax=Liparis tanakae TaxID=230148 RepID=A0A4Z2GXF1_9TELE|nr:hypothetical protein EYF80_031566 [Liparis tanakae]